MKNILPISFSSRQKADQFLAEFEKGKIDLSLTVPAFVINDGRQVPNLDYLKARYEQPCGMVLEGELIDRNAQKQSC